MTLISEQTIPVISLKECEGHMSHVVQQVGQGLADWGFIALVDHGVSSELISKCYQESALLFNLPEDRKLEFEDTEGGRQRGYTPFLLEKAKGQKDGDLKEFWHIGRSLSPMHPSVVSGQMKPNLFPPELPTFQSTSLALYDALDELAFTILEMIADYFLLPRHTLASMAKEGNSILRILHYPALKQGDIRGRVRAAAHEDINLLTLLPTATQPGLEIQLKSGEWLPVNVPSGAIICDTGDMMSVLTNGALPAVTHRVVNPDMTDHSARLSMPFFMHPSPTALLRPFGQSEGGLTADDFLKQRLQENGLV